MKKIFAFVLMAVLVLSLSAAAFAAPAYNVGICQLVQHPALDAATQGFQDALKEELGEDAVKFSVQNASGDSATCAVICNQFVSDEVDLILANATPALLAAQSSTNQIPILGTSVTDYASALDIDDWNGATGTNISGTSDGVPAQAQAKVKDYTFADSNDVAQVAANACDDCDVLYIPTDNTAASNAELINNVCLEKKVPVVAGEENLCAGCGCVTLSISYYDLGVVTGKMAAEILANGADISTMEIEYAPFTGKYNAVNCELLGVEIPEGFEAIETEE